MWYRMMDGYYFCEFGFSRCSPRLLTYSNTRKALLILSLPPISPSPFPSRDSTATGGTLDLRLAAMDALVASVKLVPHNWSAWLKLTACLDDIEEVNCNSSRSRLKADFIFSWRRQCPLYLLHFLQCSSTFMQL